MLGDVTGDFYFSCNPLQFKVYATPHSLQPHEIIIMIMGSFNSIFQNNNN